MDNSGYYRQGSPVKERTYFTARGRARRGGMAIRVRGTAGIPALKKFAIAFFIDLMKAGRIPDEVMNFIIQNSNRDMWGFVFVGDRPAPITFIADFGGARPPIKCARITPIDLQTKTEPKG